MFKLSIGKRYLLSLLSGLLFTLAFPFTGSITPLVFVAWVPLLLVEKALVDDKKKAIHVFIHAYLVFILFNIGTTWWIWNADLGGAIMAFIFNSLLMALTFLIYHLIKKRLTEKIGIWSLLAVWICFEYLHYNWELSHPWLTMGNFFSISPKFIQWYEFTGVLGGTLWVLLVNILVFLLLKNWKEKQKRNATLIGLIAGVTFPIIVSIVIYLQLADKSVHHKNYEVVIVQPNIDPYKEKFNAQYTPKMQMAKFISLAKEKITNKTKLVIGPETAVQGGLDEDTPMSNDALGLLNSDLLAPNSPFDLLIGASTYRLFSKKNSSASQQIPNSDTFYESYNTSLFLQYNTKPQFIHKSKLVLGVEKIPFSSAFPFLEEYAIQNGGTSGSLGIENHAKIFNMRKLKVAPIICYESIYGDFLTQQTRLGAKLFIIITNDGWWGDTPGYKQHYSFAQLRAIENRRYVIQAANTGTSGVINDRGEVLRSTPYSQTAVMNVSVPLLAEMTYYAKHGDYIGIFAIILFGIMIGYTIFNLLFKKAK
jgi:apolipoprotein N-acyltransferase